MPITAVTNVKSPYLLVHVGWGRDRYYRVVPIKKDLKKAWKVARELDESLKQRQAAYRQLQKMSPQRFFHTDGRIIGVRVDENRRAGRKPVIEFKLRVVQDDQPKPAFTSISISKHGFDAAFDLMISAYAELAKIEPNSPTFELLKNTREVYRALFQGTELPTVNLQFDAISAATDEDISTTLMAGLQKEIEQFKQKQMAEKSAAKKPGKPARRSVVTS